MASRLLFKFDIILKSYHPKYYNSSDELSSSRVNVARGRHADHDTKVCYGLRVDSILHNNYQVDRTRISYLTIFHKKHYRCFYYSTMKKIVHHKTEIIRHSILDYTTMLYYITAILKKKI